MKAVAFYLPQYHAIPENDLWWGKGFTEWTNVRKAAPLFTGHYQPHIPHKSIGYYDLADIRTIERQHALAFRHGISSFCYYYYNFSGVKPLERPLIAINANKSIRNRFCLCWANHDWTRTWYGQSKEVLIRQEYSAANALDIYNDLVKYFKNPRHITIDGKPLFLVFNPEDNPVMREYADIWREQALRHGFGGLFLIGVESLTIGAGPENYGFDAALEFAPDWSCTALLSDPARLPRIFDYKATVRKMLTKPVPPYPRLRCVFPGWDNTPRYGKRGTLFGNTSLGAFKYAIDHAVAYTREHLPEHLHYVFINAWNEWGEGCHLEPDEKDGFLPLEITAAAFSGNPQVPKP